MNKAAVRRALTTLKKQGLIDTAFTKGLSGNVLLEITVDAELIQPKKRVYIRKTKTKKDFITDGGMSS